MGDSRNLNLDSTYKYFEPDIITADQNYGDPVYFRFPAFALMTAVMDNALDDIRGQGNGEENRRRMRLASDALDWVLDDEVWPYSFVFCCQHLSLDVDKMRTRYISNYLKGK